MQRSYILCAWTTAPRTVQELQKEVEQEHGEIVSVGVSSKHGLGFIVVSWQQGIPSTFIQMLHHHNDVLDFCVHDA